MSEDEQHINTLEKKVRELEAEILDLKQGYRDDADRRDFREAATEMVRQDHLRYRTIFENSLLSNKIINADLKILQVNDALVRLLGCNSKADLVGHHIMEFAHPGSVDDWKVLQDKLWKRNLPSFSLETCLIRKDGKEVLVNVTSILFTDQGGPLGYTVLEDIQQSRSELNSLIVREKRFRMITNIMPQQVWTAAPDGRLNFVNEQVCEYFGRTDDDLIKNGWQDFIHPDDVELCASAWKRAVATEREYMIEFRLRDKNTGYKWYLGRARPFYDDGEVSLWLGTNTDIDAQKVNEQRKDEFMSIASHELKTPLTSIKAFNQIMARGKDMDTIRPFLQRSGEHITRLERLINDLLDVTKISSGKLAFEDVPFSISNMINEVVESNRHLLTKHEILLDNEADVLFSGDRYRLEQVLNNLISNAIKYSPEGKKIVIISKVISNNVVISVQDFGIGIAKENLHKLFDRYYRVENTAMRFEGLGLGLFISSEIIKRHKGSFWIESEPDKGSTFFFLLPLPQTAEKKPVQTDVYYEDSTVRMTYLADKNRLDVDWTGFQNLQTVQAGCMRMLDILKKHRVTKIVNDNTHVLGSWSEAVDWTGNTWFPMMEQAGLKYFALVYSTSVFSQLSAEKSIDEGIGSMTARYFTDVKTAEQWIDSCK